MIKSYNDNDMVIFKVVDESGTAMETYVNNKDQLYIGMFDEQNPEDTWRMQSMAIDKQDVLALISELQRLVKDVA